MRQCLFPHRWRVAGFDGPYDVGEGFARTFGNGWAIYRCAKCGKERRKVRYLSGRVS